MSYVFIDGKFYDKENAKISVFDHGLLYGDGVFEGIRAYNNHVFKLKEHIDRLFDAAKTIDLKIPYSKEEIMDIVCLSCAKNNISNGYIRLVITRGVGDLGLSPKNCKEASVICIAANVTLYSDEMYEKGLKVATSSQRRSYGAILDPQVKSLNYLNNIMAKMEADRQNVGEAVMLNSQGWVCECTGDNIFIIKDGVIYTPPTYVGILAGISRSSVIEVATNLGYEVKEVPFTLFNVYSADECFLTGTAAELISVSEADGRTIGSGSMGPITRQLLAAFREYANDPKNGTPIQ
ncbi:MAG TPA: branched-chain-amino-acid transaminase [Clostridiales bacterium]|nr:branched-chain-amino-acid transaminase [Clostridiales bacterium]